MKKARHNKFLTYLVIMILSGSISIIGCFYLNGIPLLGIPKIEDVSYVEISDTRLDIEAEKFTESEDIEKAVHAIKLLSYKLGTPEQEEPLIKFVFHLKDGNSFAISANEKTAYSKGKAYKLKGDNGLTFIKVTEGMFFFEELVEKEEESK